MDKSIFQANARFFFSLTMSSQSTANEIHLLGTFNQKLFIFRSSAFLRCEKEKFTFMKCECATARLFRCWKLSGISTARVRLLLLLLLSSKIACSIDQNSNLAQEDG